jgi:transcriptional regulator with XRE-family HTH domain
VGELAPAALIAAREAKGWRQVDLAREAGLSAPYVNQLERGHREPSPLVLGTLARVLEVPVTALAGRSVRCPACGCSFTVA